MSVNPHKTSSRGSKTPGNRVLRDFFYVETTEEVLQEIFGDVQQPLWLALDIGHRVVDPVLVDMIFTFTFRVLPYGFSFAIDEKRYHITSVDSKQFTIDFGSPQNTVAQFDSGALDRYADSLKAALFKNAYFLYEHDPRIGWHWDGVSSGLPRCPLLDRTVEFSRTGLPVESRSGSILEHVCPLCQEAFSEPETPVWGGANVAWVHRHCWRRGS